MKKRFLLLCAALILALVAGCQGPELPGSAVSSGSAGSADSAQSTQEPDQTGEPPAQPGEAFVFRSGTWFVPGGDYSQFYFFEANGTSGQTASLENGIGVAFMYTLEGSEVTFYMGAEDADVHGTLAVTDDTHVTVTWADGQAMEMTFWSELTSGDFHFYTNEQLCQMAAAYYAKTTGEPEPEAAADMGLETVTIQLYNHAGDHNSTCAWYQVNRQTGQGTDANTGEAVDLSQVIDG